MTGITRTEIWYLAGGFSLIAALMLLLGDGWWVVLPIGLAFGLHSLGPDTGLMESDGDDKARALGCMGALVTFFIASVVVDTSFWLSSTSIKAWEFAPNWRGWLFILGCTVASFSAVRRLTFWFKLRRTNRNRADPEEGSAPEFRR